MPKPRPRGLAAASRSRRRRRRSQGKPARFSLTSVTSNGAQADEHVKVTLLSQSNLSMQNCLAWSLDKGSFYSLENGDAYSFCIVRRVGFPDGRVIAEQRLEELGAWLSLSSEGVVVTCPRTKTVKVLDHNSLKVNRTISVPDVKRAISAPAIDFALVLVNSATSLQTIDLKLARSL